MEDQDSIRNMERITTLHLFSIPTGIALRQCSRMHAEQGWFNSLTRKNPSKVTPLYGKPRRKNLRLPVAGSATEMKVSLVERGAETAAQPFAERFVFS